MPKQPSLSTLYLKVTGGLENTPRAKLLARAIEVFASASPSLMSELPSPIRVTLVNSVSLPGGSVGCFRLGSRGSPASRWEVRIAHGGDFDSALMAEAWVCTLPHELLHLRDFFASG